MGELLRLFGFAKVLPRLGLANIYRVLRHRILLKLKIHPVCKLRAEISRGPYFQDVSSPGKMEASQAWIAKLKYFDWFEPLMGSEIPDWFAKPFSGGREESSNLPWWHDDKTHGAPSDIKEIWDLSRFNWALSFAQRAANGDGAELKRLNDWIGDWVEKNPPYMGPNWRCGQEASIRVMHLAITALILHQDRTPFPAVTSFVRAHLVRIAPTLHYALAQDNNHGVLEAAGLFVGGAWLNACAEDAAAHAWSALGRQWLEERARRLIFSDGGFSMYSVTYHREFLDALSFCEFWRRRYALPSFSAEFYERARKAALWLNAVTHPVTGDAPNIGANDGTRLLPLTDTDYRDFRPSVQLSCVLFAGARAYSSCGSWDFPLQWLGIALPEEVLAGHDSEVFSDSGLAVMQGGVEGAGVTAFFRLPKFNFRPSHADALHLDCWIDGGNLLRDGGSYTYGARPECFRYFAGTASHNTVQFDDRDQMPLLSRFLFGAWLKPNQVGSFKEDATGSSVEAAYRDHLGGRHARKVTMSGRALKVVDRVSGFKSKAVLRWRLSPGDWTLRDGEVFSEQCRISVCADVPVAGMRLASGWESRYYFNKNKIPVLEVEIRQPGTLTTEIVWAK